MSRRFRRNAIHAGLKTLFCATRCLSLMIFIISPVYEHDKTGARWIFRGTTSSIKNDDRMNMNNVAACSYNFYAQFGDNEHLVVCRKKLQTFLICISIETKKYQKAKAGAAFCEARKKRLAKLFSANRISSFQLMM